MATIAAGPTVTPLHSVFAAEVSGVDLSRPLDDATFERIAVAFDDHSMLVFRGQALPAGEELIDAVDGLALRVGAVELDVGQGPFHVLLLLLEGGGPGGLTSAQGQRLEG